MSDRNREAYRLLHIAHFLITHPEVPTPASITPSQVHIGGQHGVTGLLLWHDAMIEPQVETRSTRDGTFAYITGQIATGLPTLRVWQMLNEMEAFAATNLHLAGLTLLRQFAEYQRRRQ